MERTTEFSIEIETTESYMDLSFSRAPKKNHDALAQLGKQYVQWRKKHGVRGEIYYLVRYTFRFREFYIQAGRKLSSSGLERLSAACSAI